MPWYHACPTCCVWIEAVACPGNDNPGGLRLFVRNDDPLLTGLVYFRYGTNADGDHLCWTVNAADPLVFVPSIPEAVLIDLGELYTDCTDCETPDAQPDSPGVSAPWLPYPGGGGTGGGGGPNNPGSGDPTTEPPPDLDYVKLVICPKHEPFWAGPDLYTVAPDSSTIVHVLGYCFTVPTTPTVEEIPEGARGITVGGATDDCDDCTDGRRAILCPDQDDMPGIENAPVIWVRKPNLPVGDIGFKYANFCYQLLTSTPLEIIPWGAISFNPNSTFEDCLECNPGVRAVQCDDTIVLDYELWVPADAVPEEEWTWRYKGVCFRINPEMEVARIPFAAVVSLPLDEYEDCEACRCGLRDNAILGVKANLCSRPSNSPNPPGAPNLWIQTSTAIGPPTLYFRYDGFCWWVSSGDEPQEIPSGAEIISRAEAESNTLDSCNDCLTNPPTPPDVPPWFPPDPPERWFQLRSCADNSLGGWVRENHLCAVLGIVPCDIAEMTLVLQFPPGMQSSCWRVIGPPADEPGGEIWTSYVVSEIENCETCLAGNPLWLRLEDCAGIEDDVFLDFFVISDGAGGFNYPCGLVALLNDEGVCRTVFCTDDEPEEIEQKDSFVVLEDGCEFCQYIQAFFCSDDEPVDMWFRLPDVEQYIGRAFKVQDAETCYYFEDVPTPSYTPGTIWDVSEITSDFPDCETCDPAPCETCDDCADDDAPPVMRMTITGMDGTYTTGICEDECFRGNSALGFKYPLVVSDVDGTYDLPFIGKTSVDEVCGPGGGNARCAWVYEIPGGTITVGQQGSPTIPACFESSPYNPTAFQAFAVVWRTPSGKMVATVRGSQAFIIHLSVYDVSCKSSFGGSADAECCAQYDDIYSCTTPCNTPDGDPSNHAAIAALGTISVTPVACT
jgi:hypothetical protein